MPLVVSPWEDPPFCRVGDPWLPLPSSLNPDTLGGKDQQSPVLILLRTAPPAPERDEVEGQTDRNGEKSWVTPGLCELPGWMAPSLPPQEMPRLGLGESIQSQGHVVPYTSFPLLRETAKSLGSPISHYTGTLLSPPLTLHEL